jgi:hypothetical protein
VEKSSAVVEGLVLEGVTTLHPTHSKQPPR